MAIIIHVRSLWWHPARGIRAFALGNVIVLGGKLLPRDLEHEYVHVRQHMREPFLHPILSFIELRKKGLKSSKYEREAYEKANNTFVEHNDE